MRKIDFHIICSLYGRRGATAVFIALVLFILIGVAALAIDIAHLLVVRNELTNAADAGALAGARYLYNEDGSINDEANATATEAAKANFSDGLEVEVLGEDVERGHWCFGCVDENGRQGVFTPNSSTEPSPIWAGGWPTLAEIDANESIVNAMRVATHRGPVIPATSFLAGIFDYSGFEVKSQAVAYVSAYAPISFPQPIVICKDSIEDGCSTGSMYPDTAETAEWTNFSEDCTNSANADEVGDLVCAGNPAPVGLHSSISTNNGVIEAGLDDLRDCWLAAGLDDTGDGIPDQPWQLTLPVVDCEDSPQICREVLGGIKVNVVWITTAGLGPSCNPDAYPKKMYNPVEDHTWTCSNPGAQDETCWNEFVHEFHLEDVGGDDAECRQKAIYFMPECSEANPGGGISPVLPKIPVLVQ